jgi:hypothetical protein
MIRRAAVALVLGWMAAAASAETVIVYARADAGAAGQGKALARAFGLVWMDLDLAPGQPWRPAIGARICRAQRVLVVWSGAAAASAEVGAEWRQALACRRVLVPVLLDDTPMPPDLARWQAVDWRGHTLAQPTQRGRGGAVLVASPFAIHREPEPGGK